MHSNSVLFASASALAGYDIHITRKPFCADEFGPIITFEQWKAYVRTDPQVVRDTANSPEDFMVSVPGESFPLWYNPELGELYTKNPSDEAITKLNEISHALDAKLQGDDGEFLDSSPD